METVGQPIAFSTSFVVQPFCLASICRIVSSGPDFGFAVAFAFGGLAAFVRDGLAAFVFVFAEAAGRLAFVLPLPFALLSRCSRSWRSRGPIFEVMLSLSPSLKSAMMASRIFRISGDGANVSPSDSALRCLRPIRCLLGLQTPQRNSGTQATSLWLILHVIDLVHADNFHFGNFGAVE